MLSYIDDEAYRRRILTQLNRGEGRHELARIIFHGKRGELRQRYREGQEDQLGALGLVVNAVILWNTIYMDAALAELRGRRVRRSRRERRPAIAARAGAFERIGSLLPSRFPSSSHAANCVRCAVLESCLMTMPESRQPA